MNPLEQRPLIVAIAGPNGAGKSTFYEAHLRQSGLRFVNADELARELGIDAYRAADAASQLRQDLVAARHSFVFETVFSDPKQNKVAFLRDCEAQGYTVVLCFIGLSAPELSDERVAMRALMGGHDVPRDKLFARYPRSLANLRAAMHELSFVRVFDNSADNQPHRLVAALEHGRVVELSLPVPAWIEPAVSLHAPRECALSIQEVARAGGRVVLDLVSEQGQAVRIWFRTRRAPPSIGDTVHLGVGLELLSGPA